MIEPEQPRYPTSSATVLILLCFSITMMAIASLFYVQFMNHKTGVSNNTYLRLNACIVSVPPQRRTPEYVKSCYDIAEKDTGATIDRYGDGK